MLYQTLAYTGGALCFTAALALLTGRYPKHRIYAAMSVACLLYMLAHVVSQDPLQAGLGAGLSAVFGWFGGTAVTGPDVDCGPGRAASRASAGQPPPTPEP